MWQLLGKISKFGPDAQTIATKVSDMVKGSVLKQSNLFESVNFRYFGPIDGHDVEQVEHVLRDLKDIPGPKILHLFDHKRKGLCSCGGRESHPVACSWTLQQGNRGDPSK